MLQCRSARGAAAVTLATMVLTAPLAACVRPAAHRTHDRTVRTRTLAWPGGDRLFVGSDFDVRYVQGQNAQVVVTGPADEIDDIVVDDGVIRHERQGWGWWNWWRWGDWGWRSPGVRIVVTAPQIQDAGVSGSGHLDLGRLTQDQLGLGVSGSGAVDAAGQFKSLRLWVSGSGAARLGQVQVGDLSADLSGSGWIRAAGEAGAVHLGISGSGGADLGGLAAQKVDAHLSGSGFARLAPKQSADLSVSGSGSIHLLTRPPQLSTHRSGSGAITYSGGAS